MATVAENIKKGLKKTQNFGLKDVREFPYTTYTTNMSTYAKYRSWFDGSALDEQIGIGDTDVEKYPIRVNPIRSACFKHASALFGDYPESSDFPLVLPTVKMPDGEITEDTKRIEKLLSQMWTENNGQAIQSEAGVVSQYMGGFALRVVHERNPRKKIKIRIDLLRAEEFIGIPDEGDPWNLREAWFVRKIDEDAAREYGVLDRIAGTEFYYIEHWTKTEFTAMVNDIPLMNIWGDQKFEILKNPYGFVPFVYFPHTRSGKSFYGDSLVTDAAKGLTREINARLADAGDAVSDDTHIFGVMSNVRGNPNIIEIAGRKVINLGSSQQLTGINAEPSLDFPSSQKASDAVMKLDEQLTKHLRRELIVPAVADGEDEGSQRSSLTLNVRMMPLMWHVKMERNYWTTGLRILHRMAIDILEKKGMHKIAKEHLDMRYGAKWYPLLPRDRETIMNEIAIRGANNIGSIDHLMRLTGDIDNIPQQKEQIMEWLRFLNDLEIEKGVAIEKERAKSNAFGPPQQNNV